jgi:pilus assembly protein Flp/PilA
MERAMKKLLEKTISFINGFLCGLISGVRGERGQTLVEYGLLLVLIAVVIFMMVKGVGLTTSQTYSKINCAVSEAAN